VAYNFSQRDMKYGTTKLKVPAVVQAQREGVATYSVPMTFGNPMETLGSIPGKSQMPQVTYRLRSSQMTVGLRKPKTQERIPSLPPAPVPDLSMNQTPNHFEPVSYNP